MDWIGAFVADVIWTVGGFLNGFFLAVKSARDFGKGMAEVASLGVKNLGAIEKAVKRGGYFQGIKGRRGGRTHDV